MKSVILLLVATASVFISSSAQAQPLCPKPKAGEPIAPGRGEKLYSQLNEVDADFQQLYASGKRIESRAYWNGQEFVFTNNPARVLPLTVINAISSHISEALRLGYADYAFYPDMGHVHILVPESASDPGQVLQRGDLKFLYHTAETIELKKGWRREGKLTEDPWLLWRYHSRNFLGDLNPERGLQVLFARQEWFNTVRVIEGYRQYMTLYFSSSTNGCFQYQTKKGTLSFDIGE